MTKTDKASLSLLHMIKNHFGVDAVMLSTDCVGNPLIHQSVLTDHCNDVEVIKTERSRTSAHSATIGSSKPIRLASSTNNALGMTCSFMVAENLDAILSCKILLDEDCIGSIKLMHGTMRLWSDDEVMQLEHFATAIAAQPKYRTFLKGLKA